MRVPGRPGPELAHGRLRIRGPSESATRVAPETGGAGGDFRLAGAVSRTFHAPVIRRMPSPSRILPSSAAGRALWAVGLVAALLAGSGCQTPPERDYEPVVPRFFLEVPPQVRGATSAQLPRSGVEIAVSPAPVLSELDVRNVELVKVDLGLCLMFEFTADGARDLMRLSGANLGRRIVVTLNGRPFGARLLDGPLVDGRLLMFIELADEELTETAVNLKRTAHEVQSALAEGRGKKK